MNLSAQINRRTEDYQQSDAAHHIHGFVDQKALNAEGPRVMVRGEGLYLWDSEGKRYLDGMSGLWCTQLGYGRRDLTAAAAAQMDQLAYYNMFFHTTHPAVIELSELLFSLLPGHYSHVIYTKLDIGAQSELFALFIDSLAEAQGVLSKDPLESYMSKHR